MYTPSAFAVSDLATLHGFMQRYSFATLISASGPQPEVSHLPLLLDRNAGPNGRLIGHMAKANEHWKTAEGHEVLVLFHGPHAYISPSWYEEQNVVPTWNYVAVHVRGIMQLVTNAAAKQKIVADYVTEYEAAMPTPWALNSADQSFVDGLTDAIVCFTIDIEHIEGKSKLSQNHTADRRQKVVDGLRCRAVGDDLSVADLMQVSMDEQGNAQ